MSHFFSNNININYGYHQSSIIPISNDIQTSWMIIKNIKTKDGRRALLDIDDVQKQQEAIAEDTKNKVIQALKSISEKDFK